MKEELTVLGSITRAVKEVAITITQSKTVNVHPELYDAIMEQVSFIPEALMVAISHLVDNKAQGVRFVSMGDDRTVLSRRTWLGKHYYWCCFCWWRLHA
ncbi:Kelch-like protein 5 [Hordeum vulgare]|nr:Kelch-like protein 5 [Hordeum vulgare]